MTTYNTGNPLGSTAPKDLHDNAESLDRAVNDVESLEWTDRFGRQRKTMHAVEQSAPLAQEAADRAKDEADRAEDAADAAEDSADQAELYALAAQASVTFYDTIALGLAAVADGETFGVYPGGADDLPRPTIFRRDSSSTETKIVELVGGSEIDEIKDVVVINGDDFLEVQAADGSVLHRFDAGGSRAPILSGRVVAAMDNAGRRRAELTADGQNGALAIEGGDGLPVAGFRREGLVAPVVRPRFISASRDMSMGFGVDKLIPAAAASSMGLAQVNHMIMLGRSLMAGRGTPRYTQARFRNWAGAGASVDATSILMDSLRTLAPCSTSQGGGLNEQMRFMAADHCMELLLRHKGIDPHTLDCRWLMTDASIGGTNISDLRALTLPDIEGQIATAKAMIESLGLTYRFAGFAFCHAENGWGMPATVASPAAYEIEVRGYMEECRDIVEAQTGQLGRAVPFFFILQGSENPVSVAEGFGGSNKSQYRISRDDGAAYLIGSCHPVERITAEGGAPDGIHISGYGTVEAGIQLGRAMYRHFFAGEDCNGMLPIQTWASGDKVFVRFNRRMLTARTTSGNGYPIYELKPHFGLAVSNLPPGSWGSGYTQKTIESSTLVGEDTVCLTLSTPAAAGDYLHCGASGLARNLDPELWGDKATDGTEFEPYEIALPFVMEIAIL